MKAYAVFAGGGVKGAALAGAYAAIQTEGLNAEIEFQGFGGTSAGALIAALASVGFSGREIRDRMKTDVHPEKLLDDGGKSLKKVFQHLNNAKEILNSDSWGITKAKKLNALLAEAEPELKPLKEKHGLYRGMAFRKVVLGLLMEKLEKDGVELDANTSEISFEDLAKEGYPELRIIASNLTLNQAIRFSRSDQQHGSSVVAAVSASAGYPFLFQPQELNNGHRLSDGGLSSNLPAFLFADEYREKKWPTIAFNLVNGEMKGDSPLSHLKELAETAFTASDRLLQQALPGIIRVDIPIPDDVGTLDFALEPAAIDKLYNAGHTAAVEMLGELRPYIEATNRTKAQSADDVKELADHGVLAIHPDRLQEMARRAKLQVDVCSLHGERRLFEPPLWALAKMIEENSDAEGLRTNIMLPTFENDDERIVAFCYGFRSNDQDRLLLLRGDVGCTGVAISERSPVVANLDGESQTEWGLTEEEVQQVADDRRSLICAPIFERPVGIGEDPQSVPIVGVLSVDSSTELTSTKWLSAGSVDGEEEIRGEIVEIIVQWSYIFTQLFANQGLKSN